MAIFTTHLSGSVSTHLTGSLLFSGSSAGGWTDNQVQITGSVGIKNALIVDTDITVGNSIKLGAYPTVLRAAPSGARLFVDGDIVVNGGDLLVDNIKDSGDNAQITFDGSGVSTTIAGDLFVNDYARIDALRVGVTSTDPGDGVLHVEGSIQTPEIKSATGNDAISIANDGTMEFAKGISSSPAVFVGYAGTVDDGAEWFKIASLPTPTATSSSHATFLVNPVTWDGVAGPRGSSTFIIDVKVLNNSTPTLQALESYITVERSRADKKQITTWNAIADIAINYSAGMTVCDLWFRVNSGDGSGPITNLYVTPLGGTGGEAGDFNGPAWKINTSQTPSTSLPGTNSFIYGEYANKIIGVITGSSLQLSGTSAGVSFISTNTSQTGNIQFLDSGEFALTGSATNPTYSFVGVEHTAIRIRTDGGGSNDKDASIEFATANDGTTNWSIGCNNSTSDSFNINTGVGLNEGTSQFELSETGRMMLSNTLNPDGADVGSPSSFSIYSRDVSAVVGDTTGIAFSVDATSDNVGGAITFERTGAESQGQLKLYTKQSTSSGVVPVVALTLTEDGHTFTAGELKIIGNVIKDSAANSMVTFNGTGDISDIADILDTLKITGSTTSITPKIILTSTHTTNTSAGELHLQHYNGGAWATNVNLGEIKFKGSSDGSDWGTGASIQAAGDGAGGTNDYPGRLEFWTTADGASTGTKRLTIDKTGLATFVNDVTISGAVTLSDINGGYGSSGVTVSGAGAISANSNITADGYLVVGGNAIYDGDSQAVLGFLGQGNHGIINNGPRFAYGNAYTGEYLLDYALNLAGLRNFSGTSYYSNSTFGLQSVQTQGYIRPLQTLAATGKNTTYWTFTGTDSSTIDVSSSYAWTVDGISLTGQNWFKFIRANSGICSVETKSSQAIPAGFWYIQFSIAKNPGVMDNGDYFDVDLKTDSGSWVNLRRFDLFADPPVTGGGDQLTDNTVIANISNSSGNSDGDGPYVKSDFIKRVEFTCAGTSHYIRLIRVSGNATEEVYIWNFEGGVKADSGHDACIDMYSGVGGFNYESTTFMRFFDASTNSAYEDPVGSIQAKNGLVSYTTFTGAHGTHIGSDPIGNNMVVKINNVHNPDQQESVYDISLTTTAKDKSVIGVYGWSEKESQSSGRDGFVYSIGNGHIWVCSENGNIEIGDYLCSSNIAGHAMLQDEAQLMNYTVAKATSDVDWSTETTDIRVATEELDDDGDVIYEMQTVPATVALMSCTYHAG